MGMESIVQFQKAIKDPDVRAALSNVLHPQIVEDLPYILRVAKENVFPGGAAEEVVQLIQLDDDPEPIKEILDAGECDVNVIYGDESFLHRAVQYDHTEILEYLVDHPSIDINIRDSSDIAFTALGRAVDLAHTAAMEVLLKHKDIDVNARDSDGDSPLVIWNHNPAVDRILLADARVDVNVFEAREVEKRWTMQASGPPICLVEDCGNEMSLRTGVYDETVWHCNGCGKWSSPNTARYFCCDEHDIDICQSCSRLDEQSWTPPRKTAFHHRVARQDSDLVREWLKRPDLDVNKHDIGGFPAMFECFQNTMNHHQIDPSMMVLDALLEDQRTTLSLRNNHGQSVMDFFKFLCTHDVDLRDSGRMQDVLDVVRRHERIRLQRAKAPVKILKDWCIETPTTTTYFPVEVLSNNVLPCLADVVSPLEEIGGAGLQ